MGVAPEPSRVVGRMIAVVCLGLLVAGLWGAATVKGRSVHVGGRPLPEGCSLQRVRGIYQSFFRAINTGNRGAALNYIASPPELNGFSVSRLNGEGWSVRNPAGIYARFARRARQGRRFSLMTAGVEAVRPGATHGGGPWQHSGPDPLAAVGFALRVAGGSRPVLQAEGKAGINCTTGRFYMLAMVEDLTPRPARECGNKPIVDADHPPRKPVMCRRPY